MGEGVSDVWGCTKSLTVNTAYSFECGFKPDAVFGYCVDTNNVIYYDSAGTSSKSYRYYGNNANGHSSCYLKSSDSITSEPSSTGIWDINNNGFKIKWGQQNISSSTQRTYHITAVKFK